MEANGLLNGAGEAILGHRVLEGTDLEIAYGLSANNLTLEVNKGGVNVGRFCLLDAAADLDQDELFHFNSFAPDLAFRVGDSQEGLNRMLASAGMGEPVEPQKRGFIRWLLGR